MMKLEMGYRRWGDEELLQANSAANAAGSFAAFYDRYERIVAAYHVRRSGSVEEAADRTAETFARALEARHRFEPEGTDSAVRWLFGIARNVGYERVREAIGEQSCIDRMQLERPTMTPSVVDALEALKDDEAVAAAVQTLPRRQQRAVMARVVDDVSYAELAVELNSNEPAVRQRVSRGLSALREKIKEAS